MNTPYADGAIAACMNDVSERARDRRAAHALAERACRRWFTTVFLSQDAKDRLLEILAQEFADRA
jgi:hypothetical protein